MDTTVLSNQIVAVLVALGSLTTVIITLVNTIKTHNVGKAVQDVRSDVEVVRADVNNNLTVTQNRVEQLTATLTSQNMDVPKRE
jgi:hypothetical protein